MKKTILEHALIVLALFAALSNTLWGQSGPGAADMGSYLLQIHQRIIGVGKALLDADDALLFRLRKKRPVDVKREAGRLFSARRQIVLLRRLAARIEPQVSTSDPHRAKIQSLKALFVRVIKAHQERMKAICTLAGEEIRAAAEDFAANCPPQAPAASGSRRIQPLRGVSDAL